MRGHVRALALLTVVALSRTEPAHAQELVVNAGFELYSRCPTGIGVIDGYVDNWRRTSVASTDYQNTCGFSAHAPRNGEGHVGFLAYDFSPNYREYATGELSQLLVAGRSYRVELWVILDPGRLHAVQEVGAYFSVDRPSFPGTGPPMGIVPQVVHGGGVLDDKMQWMLVTGSFQAAGGEQFVTIGNFFDDAGTTTFDFGCCGQFGAYYHLDDVSVVEEGAPTGISVACAVVADHCADVPALDSDGQLDFGELVDLEIRVTNLGSTDVTSYAATLESPAAAILDPPGGALTAGLIPPGGFVTLAATIQLPPSSGPLACGDAIDLALVAQSSDSGGYPDAPLDDCDVRLGDPDADCESCEPSVPCLWRADLASLSPVAPPLASLFMPATPEELTIAGPSYQCPIGDGDLEIDAGALDNGVPLSFYQVDVDTDTLRLGKSGTTIRFGF